MPRSPFPRPTRVRATGSNFLIACEGDGEKAYLEAIRQSLRLSDKQIVVLNEKGTDPLSVIRSVLEYRAGLKKEGRWLKRDSAWSAFDGDEHRDNNPANWHQALDLAQAQSIKLALSNPSLELWYLLHFQDQQAYIHRHKAVEELRKHIPQYQKPLPLLAATPEVQQAAIVRAARLAERNQDAGWLFYNNPFSGMGKLIKLLLELDKSL